MSVIIYTLGSVFIVSCISLIGAFTLSLKDSFLNRSLFFLVSLAVGALFGDAIIHLLPETFASFNTPDTAALFVLVGILLFFILEKFLHWHHHHGPEHEHEVSPVKPLGKIILVSDGIHNFIDGIIIAASYMVSIEVGIATTIAIILHEIPQEIGDFAILIHAGYTKARALFLNFLSGLISIAGALFALSLLELSSSITPVLIAIAAGSFLYIAGSDLVPELHKTLRLRDSLIQLVAIILGVALMFALLFIE
jgi:zinc and cadmium transporter